jgi:hypothetical protein
MYVSAKTLVRPYPEKKSLISELETYLLPICLTDYFRMGINLANRRWILDIRCRINLKKILFSFFIQYPETSIQYHVLSDEKYGIFQNLGRNVKILAYEEAQCIQRIKWNITEEWGGYNSKNYVLLMRKLRIFRKGHKGAFDSSHLRQNHVSKFLGQSRLGAMMPAIWEVKIWNFERFHKAERLEREWRGCKANTP